MRRTDLKWIVSHRISRGVTLVELAVVIAILGILAAFAVPSMGRFINDTRVSNATNELVNAINLARMEAIKRGELVTICSGANCSGTGGTNWAIGWTVFVESSSSGALATTVDAANVIVQHGTMVNTLINIQQSATATNDGYITFNSTGEPIGRIAGFGVNVSYGASGEYPRQICMSRSGRIRVIKDAIAC